MKRCVTIIAWGCLLIVIGLTGCERYTLSGRVFESSVPGVMVVSKNDARLDDHHTYPAAGVVVEAVIDPETLRPIAVGRVMVDRDGWFTLPVDASGAGLLEYDVEITVTGRGYSPLRHRMRLPGSGKRLLITMANGRDVPLDPPDVIRESIEAGKRFD